MLVSWVVSGVQVVPGPHTHMRTPPRPPRSADTESDADGSSIGGAVGDVPHSPLAVQWEEVAVVGEGMRGAQMLVWLGDFNYRIDGGYEAVKERAIRNELGPLLELVGGAGGLAGCLQALMSLRNG